MKLFQCNVEGNKHLERVFSFIDEYIPDVLCLQEADMQAITLLQQRGFQTDFLPMRLCPSPGIGLLEEGVVLAARSLITSRISYWNKQNDTIVEQDHARYRETTVTGFIVGDCIVDTVPYTIATTHFAWTPRGEVPNDYQIDDMKKLLRDMQQVPPHVFCGDFNIPRNINPLYMDLLSLYTDAIPKRYTSSLDKTYHRLGSDPKRAHLFTNFMVDYIFSTEGYMVSDVEFHFGISDHAAITATVERQ